MKLSGDCHEQKKFLSHICKKDNKEFEVKKSFRYFLQFQTVMLLFFLNLQLYSNLREDIILLR